MDHFHYYCRSSKCDYRFFSTFALRLGTETSFRRRGEWEVRVWVMGSGKLMKITFCSFDHTHTERAQKSSSRNKDYTGNIIIKKPLNETAIWKFTFFLFGLRRTHSKWMEKSFGVFSVGWLKRWARLRRVQCGGGRGRIVGIENIYWNNFWRLGNVLRLHSSWWNEEFLYFHTNKYQ